MSPRLALKKFDKSKDTEFCPSCGAPFDHGAVVCVKCGFDRRTGRRTNDPGPGIPPQLRNMLVVLALVVVGALGYAFLGDRLSASQPVRIEPPPPRPSPAPVPITAPPQAAPAAPPAPTTPAPTATTETEAAATEPVDRSLLAAEMAQQFRAALDENLPLIKDGAAVSLRTSGGIVRRGVLLGREGEDLILADEGLGSTQTLPIATLDRNSRLQVDSDYRDRFIEHRVQQWVLSTNEPP